MITSWADEENKTNAKYNSNRGKGKNNTGDNNNKDHDGCQARDRQHHRGYLAPYKELLKEKCPWHIENIHTTEHCYQLRRALKDTPEPRYPHDKKGKGVNEGNGDFQDLDKTVNIFFGGTPPSECRS
jgi:hypothetical protein